MKKINLILWVVLLVPSIGHAVTFDSQIPKNISLSQCGINALYTSLHYHGVNLPLDTLYSTIEHTDNEVSLFQLAEFARQQGLYTKGIQHPTLALIKKALNGDSSIILQFRYEKSNVLRSHIVALLLSKKGDILYVDVPLKKDTLTDEQLKHLLKLSQGIVILSSNPIGRFPLANISTYEKVWAFLILVSLLTMTFAALFIRWIRSKKTISYPVPDINKR